MGTNCKPKRASNPVGVLSGAVGFIAALGLTACGSHTPTLDTEKVERAISDSILQKRHFQAFVACPTNTPQKKGYVFKCQATYPGGETTFLVTEQNAQGAVYYVGVSNSR